jgi:hypothetical protein
VVAAIAEAKVNPIQRPVDPAKLARRAAALSSKKGGPVTVPEDEDGLSEPAAGSVDEKAAQAKEPTVHTEMQWLLLKLGCDMGLSVWAARGDKSRMWQGHKFDSHRVAKLVAVTGARRNGALAFPACSSVVCGFLGRRHWDVPC